MKFLLIFLFPIFLVANLTYDSNHNKELEILESFDIESSFLYDPLMNDVRNKHTATQERDKEFFQTMEDAYLFIPAVKNLLSEYKIPQEFLYLAMAESNFHTRAFSKKSASGFWQFMPDTAQLLNLRIDESVDERRDLIKSTKAAAKHLSHLHRKFGKWYLAAIAYNCGGTKLESAIKEAKTDDLSVLLDEKRKLIPPESRNYIRKIIALAFIGNDEQYMLKSEYEYLLNRANAYSIVTVELPAGESLTRVSELMGIPLAELQKLNRHLKYDFVPTHAKSYAIYIPYIKLSDFKQKYHEKPMKELYKEHLVTSGDNLNYLAKKYKISSKTIKDFNNLKTKKLVLNQKIIIPIRKIG